jgi:hypothetical protein
MTTDSRNVHPYHMHEAILAQPDAFTSLHQVCPYNRCGLVVS